MDLPSRGNKIQGKHGLWGMPSDRVSPEHEVQEEGEEAEIWG